MQYSDQFMCTVYTRIDTDIATFVKCDLINSHHHHVYSKLTCRWLLTFWRNLLASIFKVEFYHTTLWYHKSGAHNLIFYWFKILKFQNYFLLSDLANKMYCSCIIKIWSFHFYSSGRLWSMVTIYSTSNLYYLSCFWHCVVLLYIGYL